MSTPMRIAIIGAGPGGLATLKTVLEASTPETPIEACLFEAEDEIGGTFRYRSYDNAELVSSKQLTAFSDHRFPLETSDHVSLPAYVDYLKSYIARFGLEQYIKLNCRVTSVRPLENQKWKHRVTYSAKNFPEEQVYDCSHIAVCTGLHVEPNIPSIPGIEHVQGDVFHSSKYKSRSQVAHRNVLILGCGETAMDIAYESIKADAQSVTMCFRTGFLSFPKQLSRFQVFGKTFKGGLPIDGLITNLFETAYVHHAIARSRLRWFVSDFVIKRVLWFLTGTQAGMNQHVGELPPDRLGRAYVFLNKSNKAMPYLNRPYQTRNPLLSLIGNRYIDPPEDANSDRYVDTCTWPQSIDNTGTVTFTPDPKRKDWQRMKTKTVKPDCVVYCTGYKQTFSYLNASYPTAADAHTRNIINASHPDLAFIGFVRPGVGAIPPIAEQQAMWWTALITHRMPVPMDPPHYHLLSAPTSRIQYGVDHSAYMSTLARDFGGAPGLWQLYQRHGLRILLTYCFGATFVTFYRLVGPFASPLAPEIVRAELAETIVRRGVLGNVVFGVVPMVFYGVVNAVAWVLDAMGLIREEKR
ncbi:flavin-containing monooxygenase [Aspergillus clavatus NRRL 1]|uniref:Dimethylaniline monooxygenase n=1 Tax=Aspergillus clavatus (strain ATCC 1007 / CBS 513.65 / DSM 816 / NCTC 3887 / NRRL 1 / QM 1276 / 107) TaxID=344612 RepID=A1CSP3_ASPCL|nr:dimethylaniline monooxygenase [Aspergillus clavatus NRRL 1]EAW06330.1 dimethylaniline monooxygenase [Aspergillus clavatus NRRL 1]